MATVVIQGFEAGQASADGIVFNGTSAYETTTVRTGSRSIRCNPASGASGYVDTESSPSSDRPHFAVWVTTLPSVQRVIQGDTTSVNIRIESDGKLSFYDATTLLGTSTTALVTGRWYWIGVRAAVGTSVPCLQIDGQTEVTATVTGGPINKLGCSGTEASAIDLFFDDYICDNSVLLAPSKAALLLPISDNANTNWRAGASGVTNLWDGANNTPPIGVASASETDLTNIESASNTGTANYIANLTTYSSAGINTGDTVLAVRQVIQHGEDIATGAKTGTFEMTGNPVIASVAFTFGNTNAHGASPTDWVTLFQSGSTASPSVTLGSSPTMKLVKTDTTTRVGCIDFMGLLVAWTPAPAAARVPHFSSMPQLLAH